MTTKPMMTTMLMTTKMTMMTLRMTKNNAATLRAGFHNNDTYGNSDYNYADDHDNNADNNNHNDR
jgi:hypothetical protein